jgi:hypothetical protein
MTTTTLKQLLEQHPEWADLPMAILRIDGEIDYIGAAGAVYESETEEEGKKIKILIFSPN